MKIDNLSERIKNKININPETQCWEWQGCLNWDGYAQTIVEGSYNRNKIKCKRGHLLGGDNLYITPTNTRSCRKCRALAAKKFRKNRR